MTRLIKESGFQESDCRLAVSLQAQTILAPLLGTTLQEIQNTGKQENILWLHIETVLGLPCFVSFKQQNIPMNYCTEDPSSIAVNNSNNMVLALKSISRLGAVLKDFGLWSPPKHLKNLTFKGKSTTSSEILEVNICLPALSWEQHQVENYLYQTKKLEDSKVNVGISLLGSYANRKYTPVNCFIFHCNQSKIRDDSSLIAEQIRRFKIIINESNKNKDLTFYLEDKKMNDFEKLTINAEFALGEVTLSLSDYLALEPGDTLRLPGVEVPLRGILRVGGMAVASGSLALKEGELIVTLDENSENFSNLGNFLEDSSINECKGINKQGLNFLGE